jgi:AcrR family transcriptional regulator
MKSEKKDTRSLILHTTWKLLEKHQGQGVRISDIAENLGISRQAVYLHYKNRTELLAATIAYVDEIKGLNQRLEALNSITGGEELIKVSVKIWCNYIPEIYGLAKALLSTRERDDAAAAAWDGVALCLKEVCKTIVQVLQKEGKLRKELTKSEAADIYYAMFSIQNWETYTVELKWSNKKYITKLTQMICNLLIDPQSEQF